MVIMIGRLQKVGKQNSPCPVFTNNPFTTATLIPNHHGMSLKEWVYQDPKNNNIYSSLLIYNKFDTCLIKDTDLH